MSKIKRIYEGEWMGEKWVVRQKEPVQSTQAERAASARRATCSIRLLMIRLWMGDSPYGTASPRDLWAQGRQFARGYRCPLREARPETAARLRRVAFYLP